MWSTFHGKEGYFWEKYNEVIENKRFKVWLKDSEDVIYNRLISSSWTKEQRAGAIRVLEEEKRDMSDLEYGQEYLALALDELRRYFTDELIEKCCKLTRRAGMKGKQYLGVDIARLGNDLTTFEIISRDERGMCRHVEIITKKKQLTTQTEQNIRDLDNQWNFHKIGIDVGSGSLGVGIFDRLMQTSDTRNKTIAMNNRQISLDRDGKKKQRILKEDMYDNLRCMMEKEEILLLNDNNLINSLRSIQIEFPKKAGMITKVRIFGRLNDIVEGLIRSAYIAKKEKSLNPWVRWS